MSNKDLYVKIYPYLYNSEFSGYILEEAEPVVSKVYAIRDSEFLVYEKEFGFYWVSFEITCKFKDGKYRSVVELAENPETA